MRSHNMLDPSQTLVRKSPVSLTGLRKAGGRHRRRGGAVIELAITLGILLNLTFGMVEFGYYFYVKNIFAGAARQGMRAGVVATAANSDVTAAVTNAITPTGWSTTNPLYTVAITDTSGNAISDISTLTGGTQFEVTVSATWSAIGKGFRPLSLISPSKVLSASCVMRKEY